MVGDCPFDFKLNPKTINRQELAYKSNIRRKSFDRMLNAQNNELTVYIAFLHVENTCMIRTQEKEGGTKAN
jgi:hypothetical protein